MPVLALVLAALLVPSAAGSPAGDEAPAAAEAPPPERAMVVKVYDGDTVTLATGDRVRLRWVNTPELKPPEPFAEEAREATARLVLNREVELSYGSVVRDGYGRLIAAIRVGDTDLSTSLLEQGLGHVFLIPPVDVDPAPLLAAQERAREKGLGIWSTERYQGELHITSFHANASGDDRENVNGEYLRVCNVTSEPIDLGEYRLADLSGHTWDLPSVTIPPGYTVKIHSGVGETRADPARQLAVYLGSDRPVWNNKRDRATIYDRQGRVVDSRLHAVKGH